MAAPPPVTLPFRCRTAKALSAPLPLCACDHHSELGAGGAVSPLDCNATRAGQIVTVCGVCRAMTNLLVLAGSCVAVS